MHRKASQTVDRQPSLDDAAPSPAMSATPPSARAVDVHRRAPSVASSASRGARRARGGVERVAPRSVASFRVTALSDASHGAEAPRAASNASASARTPNEEDDSLAAMLAVLRARAAEDAKEDGSKSEDGAKVYLVGTGPGDPGLLTLRAYQLMRSADVVLYDRLVSNEILNLVRPEATLVYVGKRAGFHTRTQSEIHELLLAFADVRATVLRLKGGDPLVFGRGGEEMDFLRDNNKNVTVEVVPGVTAAAGVGSELGIPLTHRGMATSVRLLTGHLREGFSAKDTAKASDPVDFAVTSADVDTTLVVYMGLGTLPSLSEKLLASGFPANMPAVAVERGTTVDERRVFSSIADLPEAAKACELVSPTLLIIGRTVTLSPHWPYGDYDESASPYEPRWVEQRGTPRGSDYDDWKVWLDVDLAADDASDAQHFVPTREIHVDAF